MIKGDPTEWTKPDGHIAYRMAAAWNPIFATEHGQKLEMGNPNCASIVEGGHTGCRALFEFLGVKVEQFKDGTYKLAQCKKVKPTGARSGDVRSYMFDKGESLDIAADIGVNQDFVNECLFAFEKVTPHLTQDSGHKYNFKRDYTKIAHLLVGYMQKRFYGPTGTAMLCDWLESGFDFTNVKLGK